MPRAVRGRLLSVLVLALQALTVMAMDNTCSAPQECEKRCNQVAYWQGEVKLQLTTMCFENQCFKGLRDERCAGVTNGERFSHDVTNGKGKDGKHWLQQKDWWCISPDASEDVEESSWSGKHCYVQYKAQETKLYMMMAAPILCVCCCVACGIYRRRLMQRQNLLEIRHDQAAAASMGMPPGIPAAVPLVAGTHGVAVPITAAVPETCVGVAVPAEAVMTRTQP